MNATKTVPLYALITVLVGVLLIVGCTADSGMATIEDTVAIESATVAFSTVTAEVVAQSTETVFVTPDLPVPTRTLAGDDPMPAMTPAATPMVTTTETPLPTATAAVSASVLEANSSLFPYGVVYAYSKDEWNESDRQDIREQLGRLQELGVNTIVQVFSSRLIGTGRENDWLILLDEAERINMQVIARLWPANEWNGKNFDYQTIAPFLSVVKDHPALLAYLGLHEPLEQFDSDQLRSFYTGVKELAPELAVANYMANMAIFDNSLRFPNRTFGPGICDICIIWYYPARYLDNQPAFEKELLREVLQENRELVDARTPGAQLWFLGQTYAQYQHRRQLRMPTPQEMQQIYAIAEQARVDGFLWYPWLHGSNYDQVLSSPEMEPQRRAVRLIYEHDILESTP
ncbi:MAG: hypothetical protein JXA89_15640 [Anaerolineae bacterium]|nr:hypothetical protein [Anaerolineae bacterium]